MIEDSEPVICLVVVGNQWLSAVLLLKLTCCDAVIQNDDFFLDRGYGYGMSPIGPLAATNDAAVNFTACTLLPGRSDA
jgi:hypothetical protein